MIVLNDVRMLLTYGVSPAGAEQSALGQPVTNPADRLIVDQLKAAIQQSITSVSDAEILSQRIAAPRVQSMHIASAKQRAACVVLLENVKEQTIRTDVLFSRLMYARHKLGLLERTPARPGDARYEAWKDECLRVQSEISRLTNEWHNARFTQTGMRNRYNSNCGGRLPPVPPNVY